MTNKTMWLVSIPIDDYRERQLGVFETKEDAQSAASVIESHLHQLIEDLREWSDECFMRNTSGDQYRDGKREIIDQCKVNVFKLGVKRFSERCIIRELPVGALKCFDAVKPGTSKAWT